MRKGTASVHGHEFDDQYGSPIPPIYQTAIFRQVGEPIKTRRGTDLKYSREENPTVQAFENVVAKLEGGVDALAFNSGMAALSTLLLNLLRRDMDVLITMELYGVTVKLVYELQEKLGFHVCKAYPSTEDVLGKMPRNGVVLLETITNPTLHVVNLETVIEEALANNNVVIVDNTFASPVLFNPLRYGAHYAVHSTTKYIAGHNDSVGGVIVLKRRRDMEGLSLYRAMLGTIMQPMDAYLNLRGVKTLYLRVPKQCANARAVAEFLSDHTKVRDVIYPGLPTHPDHDVARKLFGDMFGGVVSFRIRGGREEAVKFLKSLRVVVPSPSLGGTESIASYPILSASLQMPQEDRELLGIDDSLIRLSLGIEDVEDLIEDIGGALRELP